MGLFWEIFQEFQIGKRKRETGSVEERVSALEQEVDFLESVLEKTLIKPEDTPGQDFDGDNRTVARE